MKARKGLACALAVGCAAAFAAPASAADRVVWAHGKTQVDGQPVAVEVIVRVPDGANANAAKQRALRQLRVRPEASHKRARAAYTFTGLEWDALPVVQSYNPSGEAVSAAAAVQATQATWSSVSGSRFRMSYGGTTTRCPSLSCSDALDGFNDVGWERLQTNVLGVTYYALSADEADMTLNSGTSWSTGCSSSSGIDLQTVVLHENGHVAGLGHSNDSGAIMYPSYQGVRCSLGADDQAGIRALYPG
jgi:matrixin